MTAAAPDLGAGAVAAAGLVLVLAALAHWWLRGRSAPADGGIRLVASRSLGGKRLLALVEVEDQRFLLGLTDERITCLGRLEPVARPLRLRSVAGGEEVA